MQKRISNIPFHGTKEQEEQLLAIIEKHKSDKGAVMPILQEAQEVYGYLPIEVQQIVADKLGIWLRSSLPSWAFNRRSALRTAAFPLLPAVVSAHAAWLPYSR